MGSKKLVIDFAKNTLVACKKKGLGDGSHVIVEVSLHVSVSFSIDEIAWQNHTFMVICTDNLVKTCSFTISRHSI